MTGDSELNPYAAPSAGASAHGEEPPSSVRMASRGTRLVGVLLDTLIAFAAVVPGALFSVAIEIPAAGRYMLAVVALLLVQGYQWYLVTTTGQSLAKRWLGTRIIRVDGQPPGFLHGVVLRVWVVTLAGAVPIAGALIVLADALFVFRRDSRCLHDHIAGTLVARA